MTSSGTDSEVEDLSPEPSTNVERDPKSYGEHIPYNDTEEADVVDDEDMPPGNLNFGSEEEALPTETEEIVESIKTGEASSGDDSEPEAGSRVPVKKMKRVTKGWNRRNSRLLSLIPGLDKSADLQRPGTPRAVTVHGHGARVEWAHPESRAKVQYIVESRVLGARRAWEVLATVKGKGGAAAEVELPHASSSYVRVRALVDGKKGASSRATLVTTDGDPSKDRGLPPWQILRDKLKKKKPPPQKPPEAVKEPEPEEPRWFLTAPPKAGPFPPRCSSAPPRITLDWNTPPPTPPEPEPDPAPGCTCTHRPPSTAQPSLSGPRTSLTAVPVVPRWRGPASLLDLPYPALLGVLSSLRWRDLWSVERACRGLRACPRCRGLHAGQRGGAGSSLLVEAAARLALARTCTRWGLGDISRVEGREGWMDALRYAELAQFHWERRAASVVACNEDCTLLATGGGDVYTCGANAQGTAGHGDDLRRNVPELAVALQGVGFREAVKHVACGGDFAVVLTLQGELVTWGGNEFGQLGHGDKVMRRTPAPLKTMPGPVVSVAAGDGHVAAIASDGDLYAWGWNGHGNLGIGSAGVNRKTPTPVQTPFLEGAGNRPRQVACGGQHSVVVTDGGGVLAWGRGEGQRLGLGPADTTDHHRPQPITALRAVKVWQVAAGQSHSLALTADGDVWSWGEDNTGELGRVLPDPDERAAAHDGSPARTQGLSEKDKFRFEPRRKGPTALPPGLVLPSQRCIRVSAGAHASLAVSAGGTVWSWGNNTHGQLGMGDRAHRTSPCAVNAAAWGAPPPLERSRVANPKPAEAPHPACPKLDLPEDEGPPEEEAEAPLGPLWGRGAGGSKGAPSAEDKEQKENKKNNGSPGKAAGSGAGAKGGAESKAAGEQMQRCPQHMVEACMGMGRMLMVSSSGDLFSCGSNHGGGLGHGTSIRHQMLPTVVHAVRGRWAELSFLVLHGQSDAAADGARSRTPGLADRRLARGGGTADRPRRRGTVAAPSTVVPRHLGSVYNQLRAAG